MALTRIDIDEDALPRRSESSDYRERHGRGTT
jgi:hypothetical protein